jgi:hypothetical protein
MLQALLLLWPITFLLICSGVIFAIGAAIQMSAIIAGLILFYIIVRMLYNFPAPEWAAVRAVFAWLARRFKEVHVHGGAVAAAAAAAAAAKPTIYAYHPHGLYAIAPLIHHLRHEFDATRLVTLPLVTSIPGISILMKHLGIISSNKDSLREALRANQNIAITIGGVKEAEATEPNKMILSTDKKGIFELAIETGAQIVPIITHGENELFGAPWIPFPAAQDVLKKLTHMKIILPAMGEVWALMTGRKSVAMDSHVGDPICPDAGMSVAELRDKYRSALEALCEKTRPATREDV